MWDEMIYDLHPFRPSRTRFAFHSTLFSMQMVDKMVDGMLSEMNDMYFRCVQKGIGDYILKNKDERKRLAVEITPEESAKSRRVEFDFGECKAVLVFSCCRCTTRIQQQ